SSVRRLTLPDLNMDLSIPLGTSPFFGALHAIKIQVSPVSSKTVAIALGDKATPPEAGVAIYDDATPRVAQLCGVGPKNPGCIGDQNQGIDSVQWNGNATKIFASGDVNSFAAVVDSSGFTSISNLPFILGDLYFDSASNRLYGSSVSPGNIN